MLSFAAFADSFQYGLGFDTESAYTIGYSDSFVTTNEDDTEWAYNKNKLALSFLYLLNPNLQLNSYVSYSKAQNIYEEHDTLEIYYVLGLGIIYNFDANLENSYFLGGMVKYETNNYEHNYEDYDDIERTGSHNVLALKFGKRILISKNKGAFTYSPNISYLNRVYGGDYADADKINRDKDITFRINFLSFDVLF